MQLKTTKEWQKILDDAGVPNGPINHIDEVLEDEQVKAREMIIEVEHPKAGKLKMPGVAIKLSETPGEIHSAAPILGQHNIEILKEYFGYTDDEIDALHTDGVL
jgi:CoA:oxalate CoA-transferase